MPAAAAAQAQAIMDIARTEHTQAPPQEASPTEFSPAVDFVPEPTPDPAALAAATGKAPEHYIYNAKALRVHAADPAEASVPLEDQGLLVAIRRSGLLPHHRQAG